MERRPALRALAERLGILSSYVGHGGRKVHHTSDRTRLALSAAMGFDASTEAAAARALRAMDGLHRKRLIDPVRVLRGAAGGKARLRVRKPAGAPLPIDWSVEVAAEDGDVRRLEGRWRGRGPELSLSLPPLPDPGYHRIRLRLGVAGHDEACGEQRLILVPPSCVTPQERLGRRRVFGLCANLYTVPSGENWGFGDLADLRRLVRWAGEIDAAFVGINPLHALRNTGHDISPYGPVSRLFRNLLYLDVSAVPELAESSRARAFLARATTRQAIERLRLAEHVDYEGVLALKREALRLLHRTFLRRQRAGDDARVRAYRRYREGQGRWLIDFATFSALAEHFGGESRAPGGVSSWPAAYRDPGSPEVEAFRIAHREEVDFHCYVQFEIDRQLGLAATEARRRGLGIGIYQDLAIGSSADGSDAWAFPELFLRQVSVGAPPDDYSAIGQDWGLPPADPNRMAAGGYDYWIRLLRAAMAHAGALRIDHVIGLFRQFWVPAGRLPTEGAYVRFPADDLLGILALESRRAGAVVVGEDLGTVPRGFHRVLAKWGILSSRVLYFERGRRGTFKPSSRYSPRALVTANTHDMAPLAGFFCGRDLELRRAAGILEDDAQLARALAQRRRERRALCRRLAAEGLLAAGEREASAAELRGAVHGFLCRTPAVLVGISLDDLTGEVDPVNLPGVGVDRYPSWSRRLRLSLEKIPADPEVRLALAGTRRRAGGKRANASGKRRKHGRNRA